MGRRSKKNTRALRVLQKLLYLRKVQVIELVKTSTPVLTIIVDQLQAYLHLILLAAVPLLEAVVNDQPPIQAHSKSEQKLKPLAYFLTIRFKTLI